VAAGWIHSCAVNITGVTNCWGRSKFYKRGGRFVPKEVENKRALTVSVGFDHTCVLFEDYTPYCWGWGSDWLGTDGLPVDKRSPKTANPAAAANGGSRGGYKQAVVPKDPVTGKVLHHQTSYIMPPFLMPCQEPRAL